MANPKEIRDRYRDRDLNRSCADLVGTSPISSRAFIVLLHSRMSITCTAPRNRTPSDTTRTPTCSPFTQSEHRSCHDDWRNPRNIPRLHGITLKQLDSRGSTPRMDWVWS